MKRQNILELLAAAGVALAGCAKPASPATEVPAAPEAPETPETPETPWTREWTVAPGEFAEINLELAAGDTMSATFSTDGGSLKWNVHSHEGREVTMHADGDDAAGTAHHVADTAGMYSFLWKNEGPTAVRLTVELDRGASKVHSTHPAE